MAHDCSRLGLFHRQKNHGFSVLQDILTILPSITNKEVWFFTITVLVGVTSSGSDKMPVRNTRSFILMLVLHACIYYQFMVYKSGVASL